MEKADIQYGIRKIDTNACFGSAEAVPAMAREALSRIVELAAQSAQTMLGQAGKVPQSVLQLLLQFR